jgi:hypothetical protein
MSEGGQACKSGEHQQSPTILEFHPYFDAWGGFRIASSDTIDRALSTGA